MIKKKTLTAKDPLDGMGLYSRALGHRKSIAIANY